MSHIIDVRRHIDTVAEGSTPRLSELKRRPVLASTVAISTLLVAGIVFGAAWTSLTDTETQSEAAAPGTGLLGEYYDNVNFTNLKLTRADSQVNFSWGKRSPDKTMKKDSFSIRWNGYVLPSYSETYTFTVSSRDVFRLWIDGALVVGNGIEQKKSRVYTGTVNLTAGTYRAIRIEYQEFKKDANIEVTWQSPSQPRNTLVGQLFTEIPAPEAIPNPEAPTPLSIPEMPAGETSLAPPPPPNFSNVTP